MDQDAIGAEVGLGPGDIVLRGVPAPSPPKVTQYSTPFFNPCLLWPNRWMDQDAICTEVGPGPGHIVLDDGPAPPKRDTAYPSHTFRPVSIAPQRLDQCHLAGR